MLNVLQKMNLSDDEQTELTSEQMTLAQLFRKFELSPYIFVQNKYKEFTDSFFSCENEFDDYYAKIIELIKLSENINKELSLTPDQKKEATTNLSHLYAELIYQYLHYLADGQLNTFSYLSAYQIYLLFHQYNVDQTEINQAFIQPGLSKDDFFAVLLVLLNASLTPKANGILNIFDVQVQVANNITDYKTKSISYTSYVEVYLLAQFGRITVTNPQLKEALRDLLIEAENDLKLLAMLNRYVLMSTNNALLEEFTYTVHLLGGEGGAMASVNAKSHAKATIENFIKSA